MNTKDQYSYIQDEILSLREFIQASKKDASMLQQCDKLEELLTDTFSFLKMRPFTTMVVGEHVGVNWKLDQGHVTVMMGPSDDWVWQAVVNESPTCDDSTGDYTRTYSHNGKCSYYIDNTPYYSLPAEVEELISLPDTFKGEYYPLFNECEYDIAWVTNRYDGLLSGYVRLRSDKKIYYFTLVEETEFTHDRMFAVYRLSLLSRISMWLHYHLWFTALNNNVVMKFYRTVCNRFLRPTLHQSHNVVGFFNR